ncbi:hypothetical protein Poly30_42360 [Planctomycetes bacterium Poly30]|uniref:Peptidase C-terminal archaeal/bacterial domain-containing protein n=1 Tax=Saltatorellus ferox TaxID=2528018 RepID=A0A518EX75_9BACT|nr:hypothetical protein Poly30_42360 [Planctomycetes bacterium Poly30]
MNKTSVLLAAAVLSAPAFAQGTDDCTGATVLTAGVSATFDTTTATLSPEVWPCALSGGPDLWFQYTTTASGLDLTVELCGSSYDTALEIFSGTCGALVSEVCNDDFCGLQSGASISGVSAGTTYFIRVGGYNGATGAGIIVANEIVTPCSMPDALETNFDCASATAIGSGSYTGLNVDDTDNDYYSVTVANGATIDVSIFFVDATADVDLYLWDPSVACDTNVAGAGTGTGALAVGFTASDDETVTYTNTSGADQNLIIEVDMFTTGGCNDYSMDVAGAGMGMGGIGSAYCMANPNSTGSASSIIATGSNVVANNDVTLEVTGLPTNAFGFFIVSDTQGFVMNPAGSSGNLCVLGAIGRYVGPGQIQNSGATDMISLAIDLTMIPTPTGFVTTSPGDTWNFQLWHRDSNMGTATSNFSNGTSVTFQ